MFDHWPVVPFCGWLIVMSACPRAGAQGPSLEQQLSREDPAALAREAREQGDANRGALLFYRPSLSCAKCHDAGEKGPRSAQT